MKRITLLTVLFAICLMSCGKISLNNQKYSILTYDELPFIVKDTITKTSLIRFNVDYDDNYFIDLDKNIDDYEIDFAIRDGYGFGGTNPTSIKFKEIELVFDFSNDDGSKPYVLYKNKLYFGTSLKVYDLNHILENKYKVIDLNKYFN